MAVILLGCLFYPRNGGAALLMPVDGRALHVSARDLARFHLTLVGPGRIAGTLVVHVDGAMPEGALLGEGVLAVAAPMALCGPVSQSMS